MTQTSTKALEKRILDLERQLEVQKAAGLDSAKSNQYLQTILENSPIGVCIFRNSDDIILFTNSSSVKIFGYSASYDMLGQSIKKHWHNSKLFNEFRLLENKSGSVKPTEVLLKSINNHDIYAIVSWEPLLLEKEHCTLCWFYDITKLKTVENEIKHLNIDLEETIKIRTKEVRKSEESFRSLAENSQDYIMRYDRQGRHLYQNKAAYEVSGLTEEEFIGKTHHELGFEESLCELWENKINEVFLTKQSTYEIFEWLSQDGLVTLDWRLYPEFNKDGEVETILAVSRDITEYKKLERQLLQSQKTESLGTLAGGIAHDFNNMLGVIMGNAQRLLSKLNNEQHNSTHHLEEILKAGERSTKLVQQILTFSRSDVVEKKFLNMQSLIKESLQLLRATIPVNIKIETDFSNNSNYILGNKTQIHQIIINLVTNSFHSMEDGGVLGVQLKEFDCAPCNEYKCPVRLKKLCLQLIVSDSGCGISSSNINKIMDPFFTTKDVGKGTGLGLAMVYSIVQNHDAFIKIDSEIDKGTSVKICFPIIDEVDEHDDIHDTVAGDDAPIITAHILIVDDEPSLTALYQEFLEDTGYQVTVCHDGLEALEKFEKNPDLFKLVLTDQTMPNMTGKELSRELLKLRPNLPIILGTGFSSSIDDDNAEALGIRKYLMKPIDLIELVNTIEGCLK